MKKLIFSLVAVAVVIGGVIWMGYFPIAKVSGTYVWYRDLTLFQSSSQHFQEVARQKDPAFSKADGDENTRRRLYMEELIIRTVVKDSLAELDKTSFQNEVDDTINKAKKGKDLAVLAEATSQLYGMSFPRFQELVLVPQAREIVLRTHIESDGKQYGDWLQDRMKNTSVTIYFLPYKWQDGALVNK